MQTVRWLGFGNVNATTKTLVHLFPSAGTVSAPYGALCKLSIFGSGIGRQSVALEGLRLSHPDGLRIDEAFPKAFESATGAFGLEIEVSTTQPRVDLTPSVCIIEFRGGGSSSRYRPYQIPTERAPGMTPEPQRSMAGMIKDACTLSSLIVVNNLSGAITPKLFAVDTSNSPQADPLTAMSCPAVESASVKEIEIPGSFWEQVPAREMSWGLLRARSISVETPDNEGVAIFALARDTTTSTPVSVTAI